MIPISKEDILRELYKSVLKGESDDAVRAAKKALEAGMSSIDAIKKGINKGLARVGELFESGEYFLPDLIMSAEAAKSGVNVLKAALPKGLTKGKATVIIGTVKGDLHDIGKNLVKAMFEANGFEVHDLGVDVDVNKFLKAARKIKPDILAMSALLSTTIPYMREVIEALEEEGLRGSMKVMVGGAAITPEFAKRVGSDGYASDATVAVKKAKELLEIKE